MAANLQGTIFSTSSLDNKVYDVICIGSGWASRPIAARAVTAGLSALLIDNDLMGGDCPFYACVPSKVLLRSAEALEVATAVGGARERVSKETVDVDAVFKRRDYFTRGWDDEKLLVPAMLDTGTDLLRGTGKLVGEKRVAVTSKDGHTIELTACHAIAVCTGSVPIIPDIPGLVEAHPWTSKEATRASKVPEHLVILGAGAIGCEMASAYSSFAAKITVITTSAEILSSIDREAGKLVRAGLEASGVRFLLETSLKKVKRTEGGGVDITTSSGENISASEILVATGRRPRTENCGLEHFGIPVDGSPVDVDSSLRVKAVAGNWLYAVGDVNAQATLTHMCKYQGRLAAMAIIREAKGEAALSTCQWDKATPLAKHGAVPQVVFTQPPVATVGLTRKTAEQKKLSVRVIETPAVTVGAWLHGDSFGDGWAQWIVEKESNRLLGMTIVGKNTTDLIHAATTAITGGLSLEQLAHAVPCFPTMSEVYLTLLEASGV